MRTRIVVLALLLLTFARPGAASSLHLSWNACLDDGGVENITFPCNQPGTPVVLYASFELSQPAEVLALNFRLNFFVDDVTMPPFWDFQTPYSSGGCNPGLAVLSDSPNACPSAIAPLSGGNVVYSYVIIDGYVAPGAPNPASPTEGRIVGTLYQDLTTPIDLAAGQTYFAYALEFYPDAAIEAGGSCAGCSTPVNLLQPNLERSVLRSRVTFDLAAGGTYSIYPDHTCVTANGGFGVCLPTPTRRSTWGLLKSLYR